jgi:hypothetical protein
MMTKEWDEKVAVDIRCSGTQNYLIKGGITKELLSHRVKSAVNTC